MSRILVDNLGVGEYFSFRPNSRVYKCIQHYETGGRIFLQGVGWANAQEWYIAYTDGIRRYSAKYPARDKYIYYRGY